MRGLTRTPEPDARGNSGRFWLTCPPNNSTKEIDEYKGIGVVRPLVRIVAAAV
jgi:hypothetical protein